MDFQLEQVQDFTPTPMTVSTETWYSGYHPYTLEPVFSARSPQEKLKQRMFFFWYKPEERARIIAELRRMGRPDLIARLYPKGEAVRPPRPEDRYKGKDNRPKGKQKPKNNYPPKNNPPRRRKP